MASVFKVRDRLSGTYWNGDMRWSKFVADTGKTYKSKKAAERAISYVIRYKNNFVQNQLPVSTENWEIVEYQVVYTETVTHSVSDYMNHHKLSAEIAKVDRTCAWFMDKMHNKGVADQVQFIFKLKPSEGARYVDFDRIKEARAHLRQLGVKTRTFKESNGIFGMLDREQAMRARLTLDVEYVIDVSEVRQNLGI